LQNTKITIFFFVALLCVFLIYIWFRVFFVNPEKNEITYINNNGVVIGISIPKNLNFCGEPIPKDNLEIKKRLEESLTNTSKWKNNSEIIYGKVKRWFGVIEPIIKKYNLPPDIKYIAIVESQLSNVKSSMGATGFWQLVENSAQNYNLEINEYVDERLDVIKSTEAACLHFIDAHKEFNNWTLAAAAYNRGIGGISNAIKKQQVNNYYDLNLNTETKKFIYKVLAYKTLIESPQNLGIKKRHIKYKTNYKFKTLKIDSSIHDLKAFAKKINCPFTTFKIFNPWILKNELPNPNKKVYQIRIPVNLKADYSEYIRDLIGEDGEPLENKDISPNILTDTLNIIYHTVAANETLAEITEFYEQNEQKTRDLNGFSQNYEPKVGERIKLAFIKNTKK